MSRGDFMNNLMIDLEGFSLKPDAAIASIGAAFFEPQTGTIGQCFYTAVDLTSAQLAGGRIDADTVIWWMKQSASARASITGDATDISLALSMLSEFIIDECPANLVQVWGNGANFDNVILRTAYERSGIECPWKFFNDRDVRTIVELGRAVGFDPKKDMPFTGEVHNALDDAIHQAKYVSAIWQRLIPATSNI